MHHVAIMKKEWGLIPKMVSGEKTIESRWYVTRRAPWGKIKPGDVVYFKNSGEPVTAKAVVSKVLQFELDSIHHATRIIAQYGKQICLVNKDPREWSRMPRYCVLLYLKESKLIAKPFTIRKTGFGSAAAWLCVPDIKQIMQ